MRKPGRLASPGGLAAGQQSEASQEVGGMARDRSASMDRSPSQGEVREKSRKHKRRRSRSRDERRHKRRHRSRDRHHRRLVDYI